MSSNFQTFNLNVIKPAKSNMDALTDSSKLNPKSSMRSSINSSNRQHSDPHNTKEENKKSIKDTDSNRNFFTEKRESAKELERLDKLTKAASKLNPNNNFKVNNEKLAERNSIPRNSHLSIDQLNKIAQLNLLYVKNNKKKFIAEKYLLPHIKSESNNSTNNTPTTTGHTIKINSGSISNVSSLNKTRRESDLVLKSHKAKCLSENFNKNEMDIIKAKRLTDCTINFNYEKNLKENDEFIKNLKDVNKTEIDRNPKKSMVIPSFKLEGLKRKFSLRRNSFKESELNTTEKNYSRDGGKFRNTFVINLANKNLIKIAENKKKYYETIKKTDEDKMENFLNTKSKSEKNEEQIQLLDQTSKEPGYFISLAKNLSRTVSKINESKFFKNLNSIKDKNKTINSISISEENSTQNNLNKTPTLNNQTSQIEEVTFRQNESLKKSITIDLENIQSTSNIQSKSRVEFSLKNRFRIKNTNQHFSFDLSKQESDLEIFTRPKAKTDKVNNSEIFKNLFPNPNQSLSMNSILSVSNYHNSDEENENFYYKEKINNITDPDELIGFEIKEKVKDILDTILNNELDENSEDESNKRNSIFTIFKYRPSRILTIKRKKIVDYVSTKELPGNVKSVLSKNPEIITNRAINEKRNTISKVFRSINLNNINENNYSTLTSGKGKIQNFQNLFKKGSSERFDHSSEMIIKSLMHLKNDEVDFKRQDRNSKFLKNANVFIEKNYVNFNLEKHKRKFKISQFYPKGFSNFFTKLNEKSYGNKFENFDHNIEKNVTLVLSRKFNEFLFDKYLDLFKELLIEVLNQENNFYELDTDGNKIGKTVLENFKIKQELTRITKKRFLSEFKCLVKRCNTGQGILKHFGIINHVFVNNFVIRDCFHDFKENEFDNSEKLFEKSDDNTAITYSEKKQIREKSKISDEHHLSLEGFNNNKRLTNQEIHRKKSWTDENLNSFLNYYKNKERGLKLPRRNKHNSKFNIQKFDMLTKFSVLNDKWIFNRQNKVEEEKSVKKTDSKKCKKQETIDSPMTKENTLFRTNEIKLKMLKFIDSPTQLLWFYIKDGNFENFKETFEKNKLFCEIRDDDNNSLINLAVQSNNYEIAEYLISVGADVNSQNNEMNTPLHYAIAHKNFKMADLLINKKANEELVNKNNLTPWQCIGGN